MGTVKVSAGEQVTIDNELIDKLLKDYTKPEERSIASCCAATGTAVSDEATSTSKSSQAIASLMLFITVLCSLYKRASLRSTLTR